jgi:DNA-binding transcriptional LysR family regulator
MDLLGAMRAFVAVIEGGGFAPAARKVGVATSSLTRQVDALEATLGAVLLNRSTRRVTLTAAGEDYLAHALRILTDVEEVHRSVGERDGALRGSLRVSLPVVFARLHVTPGVPDFLRQHSGIELELIMTDRMVDLVEDRVDVAIRLGMLESSSLVARRLAGHRRRLCASTDYLARYGQPSRPADLSGHRCLTFAYGSGDRTWRFSREGTVEAVRVRGPLRANDSEALMEAALAGQGLAVLPTWLVGGNLAEGRLREVLPDWTADVGRARNGVQSDAGVFALYRPERRNSGKVRAFVDFLEARFRAQPSWT